MVALTANKVNLLKLIFAFFIVGAVFLIITPSHADAQATLSISPGSGTHNVGGNFTASLIVSSSEPYNTVGATISFPSSLLRVTNISKGSFAQLCAVEPTFDNSAGTIDLGCGNTSSNTGSSTVITITFNARSEGSARVSFTDGQVLAADGQGTNILDNMVPANYTISAPSQPQYQTPSSTPEPSTPSGSAYPAPDVESSTHPDPESWYNLSDATFSWDLPSGVTSVRLILSEDEDTIPSSRYTPPIAERTIEDIEDGVWYFRIRFVGNAGLGDIATFPIQVDTVPPEDFEVEVVSEGGVNEPELEFNTTDDRSGMAEYRIFLDGEEIDSVTPGEVSDNSYVMDPIDKGEYEVEVVAVDNAGNETAAESVTITVTQELQKTVAPVEEGPGFFEKYGMAILIFIFIMIIAALIAMLILQKKQIEELKVAALRDTRAIRTTVEKVLSALRDEAQDLFASMDGKQGLNNKEQAAYDELREAIDISEELIAREIDDIEKLFKS